MENDKKQGWANIGASKKWHYFASDGRSLCRKWFIWRTEFEQGNDDSPDNCAECKRQLAKRINKGEELS